MRFPKSVPSALTLLAICLAGTVSAENRGIVIGNGSYRHAEGLSGAGIAGTAGALRDAGFRTVNGIDLTAEKLRGAVSDLLRPDEDPGARLIVLNGRFLHDDGDAWLMGTDARAPDRVEVAVAGISLNMVMGLIADARPGAVLLLGTDGAGMDHGAGLAPGIGAPRPPEGVVVLTGPPASAHAATARLLVPGTTVRDVLAADGVLRLVAGGDTGLALLTAPAGVAAPGDPSEPDRDTWARAAALDTEAAYRDYLRRFPDGVYVAAANARLRDRAPAAAPEPDRRSPAEQAEAQLDLSRADRMAVQSHLTALNFVTGGVDGVFGSRSRAAIRGWQQQNGHAATGFLTGPQIVALREQAEQTDRAFWERTGASGGADDLRAYLQRYPDGVHAREARAALAGRDDADPGADGNLRPRDPAETPGRQPPPTLEEEVLRAVEQQLRGGGGMKGLKDSGLLNERALRQLLGQ